MTPPKCKVTDEPKKQDKGDNTSSDVEPTFETFTAAEIQESQEFTSQPGTPVSENMTIFVPKKEDQLSEREKPPSLSSTAGSKASSFNGVDSSSVGQPSDGRGTWQDIEAKRRKEQDKRRRRIQYENGERGELHPRLFKLFYFYWCYWVKQLIRSAASKHGIDCRFFWGGDG